MTLCYDVRSDNREGFAKVASLVTQWRNVAAAMLGDYYPLTSHSIADNTWIAWQFNRPEQGDGVIQAFRRDKCEDSAKTFRLSGLDPAAQYELTNFDIEVTTKVIGKELMGKGVVVAIKDKPGAAVITYKRTK